MPDRPEKKAQEYGFERWPPPHNAALEHEAEFGFLAGYRSRDAEVRALVEALKRLRSDVAAAMTDPGTLMKPSVIAELQASRSKADALLDRYEEER